LPTVTAVAPDRSASGPEGTTAGGGVPPARQRAQGRIRNDNPLVGWAAALGVALLAFGLRVWHLGTPRDFSFDETYYAKDAWSMLNHGYVREHVEDADKLILDGRGSG